MHTQLEKILAIPGKPGLYQVISAGKSGTLVSSLIDGKKFAIPPAQRINSLNEISMFTTGDDVLLREVLLKAREVYNNEQIPDTKGEGKALRDVMKKILPDYDAERVYDSDIKKLIAWYNLLQSKDMLNFEMKTEETVATEESATTTGKTEQA
ncbi:MAG: DUF5606 domain-containing protein [Flavobacteriales bacterium]